MTKATKPMWDHGRYRFARQRRSPNFGKRPEGAVLDLLVIHSISLPPGVYTGDAVDALFMNRLEYSAHPYFESLRGLEVSAHFLIRRQGELIQYVSCDDRAWHAGTSEFGARPNCNDFSIGVELEGFDERLSEGFSTEQYDSLGALTQALAEAYPLRHAAAHSAIAPGRKRDPGPGFDVARGLGAIPSLLRHF